MGGEPGRSFHALVNEREAEDGERSDRRAAIAELGDAIRELVDLATVTETSAADLRRAAAQIRTATAPLRGKTRDLSQMSSADDLLGGIRMFNPVTGDGNAFAPPLRIEMVGDQAVGTCTLGRVYEGPPTWTHGGVSAMLLDQILGYATSAAGRPGMTVRLDTRYLAPVPLQTPLRLTAQVTEVAGRRVTTRGTIATAADPGTVLVAATGVFIGLRAEQAARLFGAVLHPHATDTTIAHD